MNIRLKNALSQDFATNRKPQYRIEREIGLPPTTLSMFVHGGREPNQEQRKVIAGYFGKKVKELFN